ncbi:MAG: flagellar hook-associated protein FlgK [Alphaproteobacteria bacterium]|nr:flagellar hook-associated protein FlgK [Alphaproteobacteria bacterium]
MSLNGIAASAISALKTNSAALSVVSNNVANLNTQGYARRIVNQQTLTAGGQLMGVDIASIQRVTNQFLAQEQLSAGGGAAQYDTMAGLFSQLNGLLGGPGDNQSLATGLTKLASAFATASQAPTSSASRTGVMNALNGLASTFSTVSNTISSLQTQIDQQTVNSIGSTNTLIKQIYDLNSEIKTSNAGGGGDQASALLDQRDVALTKLAQVMGIKTSTNADGSVNVSTTDGFNLVSNTYATLAYSGSAQNGAYGNITLQDINPANGNLIGNPTPLDPHLSGGSLKGLIDMRDQVLGGLNQTLGNLAQQTALSFNAQANANAAYPPPTSLTGRDTGLVGTDALNFTGKTTLAVTDSSGKLVSRIDVNFTAGTLSVNGGASASLGSPATIASFTAALNTALGGNGSASFANGQLSIAATGSNGILVQNDPTTPSLRGTTGFSQFFGLNDVFQAQGPSITTTGLAAGDASGIAAGGVIALSLKGPAGDIVKNVSITTTAGQTIGNIVTALNTALGGAATFTLNSDGSISTATSALYPGYAVNVTGDTTQRGTTGMSFSQIFGLGATAQSLQAGGFSLTAALSANPARLGFASAAITPASVAGDTIVSAGDNAGAIALQNVITKSQSFHAAGGIAAQASSLSDYAATFYQNLSTQSNSVTANQTTQDDRLTEANSRVTSNSGVNLDEELTALSSYQQAYAAGARILTVVDQLYQTLLQIQ